MLQRYNTRVFIVIYARFNSSSLTENTQSFDQVKSSLKLLYTSVLSTGPNQPIEPGQLGSSSQFDRGSIEKNGNQRSHHFNLHLVFKTLLCTQVQKSWHKNHLIKCINFSREFLRKANNTRILLIESSIC